MTRTTGKNELCKAALGVAFMAGKKAGIMDDSVFTNCGRKLYNNLMTEEKRAEKRALWDAAVRRTLERGE